MNNRRVMTAVWVVAVCGLALPAFGQGARQDRRDPAARPDGPPPALEGPRVNRPRPAGVGGDFGGGEKMGRDRIARRPAPMRAFWDAVKVLDQDDMPDALRMSPEQHEKMEALLHEQREKMMGGPAGRPEGRPEGGPNGARRARPEGGRPDPRLEGRPDGQPNGRPGEPGARPQREQMNDAQRDAMRAERGVARAARPDRAVQGVPERAPVARPEGDARPDRGPNRGSDRGPEGRPQRRADGQRPEMAPDGGPDEMERRGPREGMPINRVTPEQIEEYQTRAWSILNEAQRVVVQAELDRMELEGADEQMEQRVEQYLNKKREGAAKGGESPEGGFAGKAPQNADRRAEIAKKLSEMDPEERKAAIERLRGQMRRERGEPRPAPPVDSLRDPE